MNIKQLNISMRAAYHAAGHKGRGIIFAVFDTGVKPMAYLAGRVLPGTPDGAKDTEGHGTFVGGQLLEWCPEAQILSFRVLPNGSGPTEPIIEWLEKLLPIVLADPEHQYIVNMSLSGNNNPTGSMVARYRAAIDALVAANVPVFVAAGNDGQEALNKYPSCFQSPITVSAIDENCKRATFSTWHNEVDFTAWGTNVRGLSIRSGSGYTSMSGTSMACPNLAGAAGLIMCAYRERAGKRMTEPQLYEQLKLMAIDLGDGGRDPFFGWGVIDIKTPALLHQAAPPEPEKEEPIVSTNRRQELIKRVLANAAKLIGTDYSQAVRNNIYPDGSMDCSSYTAAIWSAAGFPLLNVEGDELRTSYRQVDALGFDLIYPASRAQVGKTLPSPTGLLKSKGQPGDVVFWNFDSSTSRANKITHVGSIDADGKQIIHTANNREKCCRVPLTYGEGKVCAIIRLREDFTYSALPEIAKPADGTGRAPEWQVRILQTALNLQRGEKLTVDGDYGSKTEAAVTALNKTMGVTGGKCSAKTWAALGLPNNAAEVVTPTPAPVASSDEFAFVTGNVNIRTSPGTEYPSLGVARAGTKLHVLPAVNGWRRVSVRLEGDLTLAYISDKYIKETPVS